MRRICLFALPLFMLTAACSGNSPTGPSAASGPGATLTGSFVSASGGSLQRVGRTAAVTAVSADGLSVAVAGTGISAVVRGGQFSLQGVPAGPLSLTFTGDGVDTDLNLDPVTSSETIEIELDLDGSTVTLESERRSFGGEVQLEGRVESLPPTVADSSLIVAGELVTTTPDTRYFMRGSPADFTDLAIGLRVHVKGQPGVGSLVASVIDIQNTNAGLPVNINGVIEAFTGDATAFELTINGRLVKGDAATELFGGTVFADIVVGAFAEVKGQQQDGFVYAQRLHIGNDDADSDASSSIHGELLSIAGAGDVLTLLVGTTTVTTDANTVVQRRGDKQTLAALVLGMTLHVVGARQADLSILARKIQIDDDADTGAFQISGSIGSVKGTCPTLSFKVNSYSVATDAATTFTPACGTTFKSGTKALVTGVVQPDGSVLATAVTAQ